MRPKHSDAGVVVERREPPLQLPLHRLGVGLVRGEHVLVGDPGRGPPPHRVEALLREPQAGALGRDVRVGHGHETLPPPDGAGVGHFRHLRLCLHGV